MRDNEKIEQSIKRVKTLSDMLHESVLENLQHSSFECMKNNASKTAVLSQIKILRHELIALKKEFENDTY